MSAFTGGLTMVVADTKTSKKSINLNNSSRTLKLKITSDAISRNIFTRKSGAS
jgi:hypothetical protein